MTVGILALFAMACFTLGVWMAVEHDRKRHR